MINYNIFPQPTVERKGYTVEFGFMLIGFTYLAANATAWAAYSHHSVCLSSAALCIVANTLQVKPIMCV